MADQIYKVRDPSGAIREIRGPEGASDEEIISQAQSLFKETPGGAAVGNPNLERYGAKAMRDSGNLDPLVAIGGATGIGAGLGAASKEILTGAGNVLGGFPQPFAQTAGRFLKGAGQVIGAGGRTAPAVAGAISGATSETAGQIAEAAGAGPVTAEAARIAGGAISPIPDAVVMEVLQKYVKTPALSLMSKFKKETALSILDKFNKNPNALSDQERKFIESEVAAIRGGPKSNEPLENVGSIMGSEADRLVDSGDRQIIAALQKSAGVKAPGGRQMADVGGDLQSTINTRYKGALDQRKAEYVKNEQARDAIVAQREGAGNTIDTTPEYQKLVAGLKAELKPGLHSPDVASDFEHILKQISTKSQEAKPPFGGMGNDPFAEVAEKKPPVSFQQLDEVRRQLGEVFRGKPPEGYKAIDAETARKYYAQISELQKKYAGEPQSKLLDDYASRTEGLEKFSSKYGKKSTALDQYREDTFATDPSTLPAAYFKTRASVQALKELTGDSAKVNMAAVDFANRELSGKDAPAVREWMGKNAEWLAETPVARRLVDNYATKLEVAERSLKNANDFADLAAKDAKLLTRQSLPAQRAVDLIKSGDTELWAKVTPAIAQSPQAKKTMVEAVRQVVADQATSKGTGDLFSRNIRPFLEGSGIASKSEMDSIAQNLTRIQEMKVPEAEKLGIMKRMLLQGAGGWAASAAGRGMSAGYNYATGVPQ